MEPLDSSPDGHHDESFRNDLFQHQGPLVTVCERGCHISKGALVFRAPMLHSKLDLCLVSEKRTRRMSDRLIVLLENGICPFFCYRLTETWITSLGVHHVFLSSACPRCH